MVRSIYYIKELSYRNLFHVLFLVLFLFLCLHVMQKGLQFPVFFLFLLFPSCWRFWKEWKNFLTNIFILLHRKRVTKTEFI